MIGVAASRSRGHGMYWNRVLGTGGDANIIRLVVSQFREGTVSCSQSYAVLNPRSTIGCDQPHPFKPIVAGLPAEWSLKRDVCCQGAVRFSLSRRQARGLRQSEIPAIQLMGLNMTLVTCTFA